MASLGDALIGQLVLGRYRIVRPLAKGGMGVIYLARSEGAAGFVKPVVVKRILPELVGDDAMVKMFVREARIMSQVRHPGVVSITDFAEENGAYLMVLDYIHGFHLGRWYRYARKTGAGFPIDEALSIIAQVLDALHYAHELIGPDGQRLNIVHRDVTPSNVLVGLDGHVMLADFGIAHSRVDATDVRSGKSSIKGKFPYLAPEIFKGSAPSPQTDVYSCGVVLHEVLAGRNEFRTKEVSTLIARVLHHDLTRLDENRLDISPAIADVVDKAVAKDPANRYANAAEFAAALRGVREIPEDVARATVRDSARRDFLHPQFAVLLKADPLEVLDKAWREAPAAPPPVAEQQALLDSLAPPPDSLSGDERSENSLGTAPLAAQSPPTASSSKLWIAMAFAAVVLLAIAGGVAAMLFQRQPSSEPTYIVVDRKANAATPEPPAAEPAAQADAAATEAAPSAPAEPEPAPSKVPKKPAAKAARKVDPRTQLTRAVASKQNQLVACFTDHASSVTGAPKIDVRFTIATDGSVKRAALVPDSVTATPLGACLLGVAKQVRFPTQDQELTIRVPITARRAK